MSHSVAVIINPAAGARGGVTRARGRAGLAARVLAQHGMTGEICVTERPGHASELTAALVRSGVSLVFAWGGDGTINEVASALAFGPAALGVVPGGSGNGLARALGIDPRAERAIAGALRGWDRSIDCGELDGRLFFNVAGVGFDAHVARLFNARARRGPVPYVTTTLREIFRYDAAAYTIDFGGEVVRQRALLIVLANGRQFGSGFKIAPQARLDDGLLDLVAVEARGPLAILREMPRLITGTVARAPRVLTRTVREVTIASDRRIAFQVDGEVGEAGRTVTVRVRPGALKVRVPGSGRGHPE